MALLPSRGARTPTPARRRLPSERRRVPRRLRAGSPVLGARRDGRGRGRPRATACSTADMAGREPGWSPGSGPSAGHRHDTRHGRDRRLPTPLSPPRRTRGGTEGGPGQLPLPSRADRAGGKEGDRLARPSRSDRMGIRLADFVVERLRRRGDDAELIDAKAIDLPMLDRMYKEYPEGEAPAALEGLA